MACKEEVCFCMIYTAETGCRAAAWTKYNLAIAQRKDNESVSSTDYHDMHSAIVCPVSAAS